MKVYLGGPINGCTDEEANGWRSDVKVLLDEHGIDYLDPMRRDYRGRELEPGIDVEIVRGDKDDIKECGVLLMNCPKPSYGTAMEILYGFELRKRVIAVLPEGAIPSPWVTYHADVHYGNAADVAKKAIL